MLSPTFHYVTDYTDRRVFACPCVNNASPSHACSSISSDKITRCRPSSLDEHHRRIIISLRRRSRDSGNDNARECDLISSHINVSTKQSTSPTYYANNAPLHVTFSKCYTTICYVYFACITWS